MEFTASELDDSLVMLVRQRHLSPGGDMPRLLL